MSSIETILASSVALTAPLAFAGVGEYVAERAGPLIISLEAMLISGAFFGIYGSSVFGNPAAGMAVGALAGLVVAWVHANMAHRLTANTFVVGLTLNVLMLGMTSFLLEAVEMTPHRAGEIRIPLLADIPLVGEPLFENPWPIYLLLLVVPASWYLISRTRWGLEARACGEDPQAADVTGIDVNKRRRQAVYWVGLMAGLGGAYLSVGEVGLFNQNMTAGRGFIAVAAEVMGMGTAWGTFAAAAVLGIAETVAITMQTRGLPNELMQMIPYIVPAVMLTVYAARRQAKARSNS